MPGRSLEHCVGGGQLEGEGASAGEPRRGRGSQAGELQGAGRGWRGGAGVGLRSLLSGLSWGLAVS